MKPARAFEVMSQMRDEFPTCPPNERREALQIGMEATERIIQIRGFTLKQVATFLASETIDPPHPTRPVTLVPVPGEDS